MAETRLPVAVLEKYLALLDEADDEMKELITRFTQRIKHTSGVDSETADFWEGVALATDFIRSICLEESSPDTFDISVGATLLALTYIATPKILAARKELDQLRGSLEDK